MGKEMISRTKLKNLHESKQWCSKIKFKFALLALKNIVIRSSSNQSFEDLAMKDEVERREDEEIMHTWLTQ
jgi:hypothetical protein